MQDSDPKRTVTFQEKAIEDTSLIDCFPHELER